MKLTDETWNQIIDEESQTIGIEAPYIRRVSRRSIERVLGSIPEQGLTDKDLATLEAIKNRADREYPASIGNQGAWLWVMSAVSGILSSHPAPAPEPDSAFGTMVDEARIPQPTPQQDDAVVVEEVWRLVYGNQRRVPLHPDHIANVTRAIEFIRRGMVPRTEGTFTLEQVEEVIREMHREPIIREGEQVITELRARLAPQSDEQEPLLNVPACRKAAIHAQTVKPALPADAHLNQFHSSPGTFAVTYQQMTTSTKTTNLMMQPQCGWQGRERDDKRCELIITAPADYDDFKWELCT